MHLSFIHHSTSPHSFPFFFSLSLTLPLSFSHFLSQEAVATIIYCAQRVEPIGEFVEVANLLSVKFGAEWAKVKQQNSEIDPVDFSLKLSS